MKSVSTILLAIGVVFAAAFSVASQSTMRTISGVVIDEGTGTPLENATVAVGGGSTKTNNKGDAEFLKPYEDKGLPVQIDRGTRSAANLTILG